MAFSVVLEMLRAGLRIGPARSWGSAWRPASWRWRYRGSATIRLEDALHEVAAGTRRRDTDKEMALSLSVKQVTKLLAPELPGGSSS